MKGFYSWFRTLTPLASVLAFVACSGDSRSGGPGEGMADGGSEALGLRVRIFQTSGLPPVAYVVTDPNVISSLGERLVNLQATTRPEQFFDFGPPTYEILNEAGFGGIPSSVRFWNGTIEIFNPDGTKTYHYDEKGVYTWLLDAGAHALPPIPADQSP